MHLLHRFGNVANSSETTPAGECMSTPYVYCQERVVFGQVLKAWFASNGWAQGITQVWAHSVDSPGPWASQISAAIKGKLDPKPAFFIALGAFNNAIAERNVLQMQDVKARNQLLKGEPLTMPDGMPYDGADFFRLFTGLIEPPEILNTLPVTDDDAKEFQSGLVQAFQEVALAKMLTPAQAWTELNQQLIRDGIGPDDRHMFQSLITGWIDLDGKTMATNAARFHGKCPIVAALDSVGAESGSGALRELNTQFRSAGGFAGISQG